MKLPTVKQCCCCIDLKPAGYVLGILTCITATSAVLKGTNLIANLCVITLAVFWLIGIYKERSSFMLPHLVLSFIGLLTFYITPILTILIIKLFPNSPEVQEIKQRFSEELPATICVYILIAALTTYFWIVTYSVYRYMKELIESRGVQPKMPV